MKRGYDFISRYIFLCPQADIQRCFFFSLNYIEKVQANSVVAVEFFMVGFKNQIVLPVSHQTKFLTWYPKENVFVTFSILVT